MSTVAGRLLRASRLALLGAALAGVVVLGVGHVLGWSALIVRSGSMEPSVPVGSLVLARPVDPGEVRLGDVIAVPREIGDREVLVLHRVVALNERGGRLEAQLRGDANPAPDASPAALDRPVARRVAVVPVAGYAVAAVRVALAPSRVLLVLVAALGLAVIWRRPRRSRRAPSRARESMAA